MKHLVPCAALAVAACLALGSPAEAASPKKKKELERGVVTLPVGYDKKTKRASTVVFRWSTVGADTHRAHLVTTDLDVVTPARLAGVHARIKSRLVSGELEARVKEGFQNEIKGLAALSGGSTVRQVNDQELVALLGAPGVGPSRTSLAGEDPLTQAFDGIKEGGGGVLGLYLAFGEAAGGASAVPGGALVVGAGLAGAAAGTGADKVAGAILSAASDGEVDSIAALIYELWCGDSADVDCGYDGDDDGTTVPPDLDAGSAAGLINLHLATGLAGTELRQQLKGLEVAGGADVGITREWADLAAWLAIDAKLGGAYIGQIQRGLDARGSQHGIRDDVVAGGGIDPNQLFNYGRITPMPEIDGVVRGVRPR